MVFMNEETANKALEEVNSGKVFATVAKELAAENASNVELGLVALDELADDLGVVFDMETNKPQVIQVADTWQVVLVKQITPAKESTFEDVKDEIVAALKNENMYDAIREAKAEIDDVVNAGEDLNAIANKFGVQISKIDNIQENVLVANLPENLKSLGNNLALNELVFSYGIDETTSAEEFDDALVVAKIVNIVDEHMPNIADVRDGIVKIWLEQEKSALAKEIAEDIVADVSDNMQLADAAKARKLEMFRSEPISRNDTFANLLPSEINDLFLANDNEVKLFERVGNSFIIVVPFEVVNYNNELTDEALKDIENRAEASIVSDMAKAMLDSYASDFKIEIDYKRAGFAE
jgi:peptidyl-prolyl cis-trans isomerase D